MRLYGRLIVVGPTLDIDIGDKLCVFLDIAEAFLGFAAHQRFDKICRVPSLA